MATPTRRPETAEDDAFLRRLTVEGRWAEFAPLPLADAHTRMLLEQHYEARRTQYRSETDAEMAWRV